MFRLQPQTPFEFLFSELTTPDTSNEFHFPSFVRKVGDKLYGMTRKGRFGNIFSRHDDHFPEYNANLVHHGHKLHVMLEGPAQHIKDHCERFMRVITNKEIPVTDVIAAGDPFDGRKDNRGFLHYFMEDTQQDNPDQEMLLILQENYCISSKKINVTGCITTYLMGVQDKDVTHEVRVHHIPKFGDFKTITFSVDEIKRLLEIFDNADTLAIHCSAGMGRTGVLELAYSLSREFDQFFPDNKPDFQKIKAKLNELRTLRPALMQSAGQYRMAVILAMELHAARLNNLSEDAQRSFTKIVDSAAQVWQNTRMRFSLAVPKMLARSRSSSENEISGDESNNVSDYSEEESPETNSPRI